jgi:hypothetical protein
VLAVDVGVIEGRGMQKLAVGLLTQRTLRKRFAIIIWHREIHAL